MHTVVVTNAVVASVTTKSVEGEVFILRVCTLPYFGDHFKTPRNDSHKEKHNFMGRHFDDGASCLLIRN